MLTRRGIKVRRSQVHMIAGPPNGGKSFIALSYSASHNLPTLYISADGDQQTTLFRALSMLTEDKTLDVEEAFDVGADGAYVPELDRINNLRFTFDPTPTMKDIALEVEAFEEMWGAPPLLIVIDNLLNIINATGTSKEAMTEVSQFLHHLARTSSAAVLILHHTSESAGKPLVPAPRHAVLQKVTELPEVILTVALNSQEDVLLVACVKNRSGPADASGLTYDTLPISAERMQIFASEQAAHLSRARYQLV